MSIELLGTNFSENWIRILPFSFKKMHLKLSSAKVTAILSRGDELRYIQSTTAAKPKQTHWHQNALLGVAQCVVFQFNLRLAQDVVSAGNKTNRFTEKVHWKWQIVNLITLSSLVTWHVVNMTTYHVIKDDKVFKLTIFFFQCMHHWWPLCGESTGQHVMHSEVI